MSKKILLIALCGVLLFSITGCNEASQKEESKKSDGKEQVSYEVSQAIYFNPETGNSCKEDEVESSNIKTGCMKWYVVSQTDDSVNLILDHNTTGRIFLDNDLNDTLEKGTTGTAEDGLDILNKYLEEDTSTWTDNLNVRFIEANEIAEITGNDSFDQNQKAESATGNWFYFDSNIKDQTADDINKSKYAWLFDNTDDCIDYGCNTEGAGWNGYWTSSKELGTGTAPSQSLWYVSNTGALNRNSVYNHFIGIRPVISVSKSSL